MFACRICTAEKGLRISRDKGNHLFDTEGELFTHVESVHHIAVARAGETVQQAMERLITTYPEVEDCACCRRRKMPWVRPLSKGASPGWDDST